MASIIPDFNYDIFISYRQKDNRHDGWVTEFVDNLKGELESTFKEEISVYFDINPHDGLLETHNVDASLKEKLKCLIFIPIISQTYCDSKSFAWQNEFIVFNKMAKDDQFGRDIRLAGGNVASRILPVKIHDLDPEDKTLLENELEGVLRCIEFIYKSAGVNRPLRDNEDHPQDNLNKTYYRDQINKVANAVKEVITAIKKHNHQDGEVSKEVVKAKPDTKRNLKPKIIIGSFLVLALLVLGYFFIPKLFESSKPVEKSIAVLPFENLSSDEEQLWFSDGITDVIISQLSKISDLRVLGRTSTLKYREEQKSISEIGKELGVNFIIEGTVQRQGNKMRISVQLIRVINEGHIWSDIYDREWKDIFEVQSDIAQRIAEGLKTVLTPEQKELIEKRQTKNPEAYNLYLQGRFFWNKRTEEAQKKSIEYFEKSVSVDPDYAMAYAGLADAYFILTWWGWSPRPDGYIKAKEFVLKALEIDKNLAEAHATLGALLSWSEWNWEGARKELKLATELNPNYATAHQYYSEFLDIIGENDEARVQINMALELDPFIPVMRGLSGAYYYHEGKFIESLDEYRKLQEIDPDYGSIHWGYFNIYVKQGEDLKAVEELQKIMTLDSSTIKNVNVVKELYNKSGMNGILNWLIELELIKPYPYDYDLAAQYARLGKKDEALNWLEKAVEKRTPNIPRINNDPDFDNLRSEPRFKAIIKKLGLSDYAKKE
jgi:TolB-like protein/Tfp pilus assembly protein PilF